VLSRPCSHAFGFGVTFVTFVTKGVHARRGVVEAGDEIVVGLQGVGEESIGGARDGR